MAKVVVNKCWGGFGLSHEAEKALVGKCEHVTLSHVKEYFGGSEEFLKLHPDHDWRKRWQESLAQDMKYGGGYTNYFDPEHIICDDHRREHRSCPALLGIVEAMGEKAFGEHARLAIIEIPDDVEYEIEDYDGRESIHEKHRSW